MLWWSRAARDYSRDRVTRAAVRELGWKIVDFRSKFSMLADWQARLQRVAKVHCVWVPCFRQRDLAAASRWASGNRIPLIFDPLISAYDKQVFERTKHAEDSSAARRLKAWEKRLFDKCDVLLADTDCHAQYFASEFEVSPDRIIVVPVGADASVFQPLPAPPTHDRLRLLFYGSFIELQAPQTIVEAVLNMKGVDLKMVGTGKLRSQCEQIAGAASHIQFCNNVPFEQLPNLIEQADLVMGVFGESRKAAGVIPNKVHQALACGRAVVTRRSDAYPTNTQTQPPEESGINWANSSAEIVNVLTRLKGDRQNLRTMAVAARTTFERYFDASAIRKSVAEALEKATSSF